MTNDNLAPKEVKSICGTKNDGVGWEGRRSKDLNCAFKEEKFGSTMYWSGTNPHITEHKGTESMKQGLHWMVFV